MQRWERFVLAAHMPGVGRAALQVSVPCLLTMLRAGGATGPAAPQLFFQQTAACQAGARVLTGVLLLLHDSRAVQGRTHFKGRCGRLAACHAVVLVACPGAATGAAARAGGAVGQVMGGGRRASQAHSSRADGCWQPNGALSVH